MEVSCLKQYIYDNEKIVDILENIGCGNIRYHSSSNYYTCSNYNGDNKNAITVYNNDNLTCVNYTRSMNNTKRGNDLIDLVCYNKKIDFIEALKYLSDFLGLDYYHNFEDDIPESLIFTKMILDINSQSDEDDEAPLRKINSHILTYYKPYVNDMFYIDNIDYETQQEFGIGYDEYSNRITIPIYSEIGDLVGVKGRLFKKDLDDNELKYIYLEPTPRYAILYGLNKTINFIKEEKRVFVVESEKAVMQGWSYGYKNIVATGGKKITNRQLTMLIRLEVDIVICFDKDVTMDELLEIKEKFIDNVEIFYMFDNDDILEEKESPTDDPIKWNYLLKNNVYKFI